MAYLTDIYKFSTAKMENGELVLERKSDGHIKRVTLEYIQSAIASCNEYELQHNIRALRTDEWADVLEKYNRLNS